MATNFSIRHAAHVIRSGGTIAYPTDTVYGLGCNPFNPDAVDRLNDIKQRPLSKHFILLAGHISQIKPLIFIDDKQKKLIAQAIEPTSWVANASRQAPKWLISNENTLTIRICNSETVRKLCDILGHAIISTSANISGKTPAKNSLEIRKHFVRSIDDILATNKKLTAKPSKIIRLCDNHIIRN